MRELREEEAICSKQLHHQGPKHDHQYQEEDYAAVLVPPWLTMMYTTLYFEMCRAHPDSKKNELDRFCIDCIQAFCCQCLPAHAKHRYVKIRRYVYCEVINRQDLCKLFNCSGIQAYNTNKAKVLFLKQRTQQPHAHVQQCQQSTNTRPDHKCIICRKSLQDPTLYCSIACKVSAIHKEKILATHDNLCSTVEDEGLKTDGMQKEDLIQSPSKRQKARKGVAQRAPLF